MTRGLNYPSDSTGPKLYTQDAVKEPVRFEAGYLLVPEGPGLGVEIDDAALARLTGDAHWTFGANLTAVLDRLPPAASKSPDSQGK